MQIKRGLQLHPAPSLCGKTPPNSLNFTTLIAKLHIAMLQTSLLLWPKNIESKLLYVHWSSLNLYAVITKTRCHHVNGDEISPFAQWWANLIEMPFAGKTHAKRRHHHTNGDDIFSFAQLWWANSTKMPMTGKAPVTSHQEHHRRWNLLKPKPCRTHRHLVIQRGHHISTPPLAVSSNLMK